MYKKKLIETSIPLDEINAQAGKEKNTPKGHPSTLHPWFARRPLAVARCIIFASMVDDPAEHPELFPTKDEQDIERRRLHDIIRRLSYWSNIDDEQLYEEAYAEMKRYAPNGELPEFLDPFAGGGALPLEAQRLGLVSHAADLNPVPVVINRGMIDIPARFNGVTPVHPVFETHKEGTWIHATGIADDLKYYASKMREIAKTRVADNYPDIAVKGSDGVQRATAIAYIWARTVSCPNPACRREAPLVRSFWLSKKNGNRAYIEPSYANDRMSFNVRYEKDGWNHFDNVPDKTIDDETCKCLWCGEPFTADYVAEQGCEGKMGSRLMAIVSENPYGKGRWYSSPNIRDEALAQSIDIPRTIPRSSLPAHGLGLRVQRYGMKNHWMLFTKRQLSTLVTLSDTVLEMKSTIEEDALRAGMADDGIPLTDGGTGARAYAEALVVYLTFVVDKLTDYSSTICSWTVSGEKMRNVFARYAIPMSWDYAEVNPFSHSSGSLANLTQRACDAIDKLPANPQGYAIQKDAAQTSGMDNLIISTDPPYYDNIGYADLSDYFYIWMRRSLKSIYPDVFGTMLTPKDEELIADPHRHEGGAQQAKEFFENGMRRTFIQLKNVMSNDYPMTVYYAYKQSKTTKDGKTSSGWETLLQALLDAGLQITGTWPVRTERSGRTRNLKSNALASSIVLVCRRKDEDAPIATRPEFQRELKRALKYGLEDMHQGLIAPVDMAQASIGPGMAAFSKYSKVIESDGTQMSVHTALAMINEQLDALMGESGEELDSETRFCLTWYEQFGFARGDFGIAETLRNARGADFAGLVRAGVLVNDSGKTWLVRPIDVSNPEQARLAPSCWSDLMSMVAALESGDGIEGAAQAAMLLDEYRAEKARSLAYLLFQAAEKGKRTEDATWFNDLVTSWADISERAEQLRRSMPVQQQLDFNV